MWKFACWIAVFLSSFVCSFMTSVVFLAGVCWHQWMSRPMHTKTSSCSWVGWREVLSTLSRTWKIQTKGIRSNCLNEVSLQRWRWSAPEFRRWTTVGVRILRGETFSKSVHYSTQRSRGTVEGMASKWPHFVSSRSAYGWLCFVNLLFRITSFIYGRSCSLSVTTGVMWFATAIY